MSSNYDPFEIFGMNNSVLGAPLLPAGVNMVWTNGDEINGPGVNFDMLPVTCVSNQHFAPMVFDERFFELFDCPSRVIPSENRVTTIAYENRAVSVIKRCAA